MKTGRMSLFEYFLQQTRLRNCPQEEIMEEVGSAPGHSVLHPLLRMWGRTPRKNERATDIMDITNIMKNIASGLHLLFPVTVIDAQELKIRSLDLAHGYLDGKEPTRTA